MKVCVIFSVAFLVACGSLSAAVEPICDIFCLAVADPVCAEDANGVQKTFNSECYMDLYNCQNPDDSFEVVHKGECHEGEA